MNSLFNSMQMRILVGLILLMIIIALGSFASLNFEKMRFVNPTPAVITVSGEGEMLAVPDIGTFSFSVTADAADAATAQEESGKKINAILAYLREQGVADKDVKVEYYNLNPKYRWEQEACTFGNICPPGNQVQDGFEVTQQVAVKVRETNKAPAIISGVGQAGATNISNLSFTIDDIEKLRAEARAKAISDAQEKAQVLAKQLGVRLVKITGFYESGDGSPMYYKAGVMSEMNVASDGYGGAELPVGEESSKVNVSVTYEIR